MSKTTYTAKALHRTEPGVVQLGFETQGAAREWAREMISKGYYAVEISFVNFHHNSTRFGLAETVK
jgi:hypothetical protein